MPSKCISFTTDFSYSCNGLSNFTLSPLPLAFYDEIEETSSSLSEAVDPDLLPSFQGLKSQRKSTFAHLVTTFSANTLRDLGHGSFNQMHNIFAFAAEGRNDKISLAFNAYAGGAVRSYCCSLDFKYVRDGVSETVLSGLDVNRLIATANNCRYYPSLTKELGVPVLINNAEVNPGSDRSKFIYYPKASESAAIRYWLDWLPEEADNPPDTFQSQMVSGGLHYFYTNGDGNDYARVMMLQYSNLNGNVSLSEMKKFYNLAGGVASSAIWVDVSNDMFVAVGATVYRVPHNINPVWQWSQSQFNIATAYSLPSPWTIERALVHHVTNKIYALCSSNPGHIAQSPYTICELVFDNSTNQVIVTPLSTTTISIPNKSKNKQINIPTRSDYILINSDEGEQAAFDLNSNQWRSLSEVIRFQDGIFENNYNVLVLGITQPTFQSSSNYLTTLDNGNSIAVWRLQHSLS